MSVADYSTVTEVPGTLVSSEAIDMVRTRYAFAAEQCEGKIVLEVACGPGAGLGLLSSRARRVVGGDYTANLLGSAHAHYGSRISLVRLDGTQLPFGAASFDIVILFEAIYFLPDARQFLKESRRVLSRDGQMLIVSVNPAWSAFNPSPHATRYWTIEELEDALRACGFMANFYLGFSDSVGTVRGRMVNAVKRAAVRVGLMPKTMKGKELLKRVVFGKLHPFPVEVSAATGLSTALVPLNEIGDVANYKVFYAVARRTQQGKHPSEALS